ncbi:MAG: hypothetical protein ACI4NM_07640 [Bullifex sp.]
MKKLIATLFVTLLLAGSVFAADNGSVTLQNTVSSSQTLQILYDGKVIDGTDNTDNTIVLTSGQAKSMAVRWVGNTNDSVKGMSVDIVTNGFVNEKAVTPEGRIDVLFVGKDIETTGEKAVDIMDGGKKVGTVKRGSAYGHCGVNFVAEPYTVGSYTIAEFTPTWNGSYNWTAGEYVCVIEFYISAP